MVKINLKLLKEKALKEIKGAGDPRLLNEVYKSYLGKKGELSFIIKSLPELSGAERKRSGKEANELKNILQIEFNERLLKLKENFREEKEKKEWIDITAPGEKPAVGHLHPLTLARRQVSDIFNLMGFQVVLGPEIETEWYNFDALNIPPDHPARDLWDTFYLKNGALLRTHTSPMQVRYMEKNNPPLRIIVPGRIFRHEATDASHETTFYQVEGLMVDKKVSAANFKAVIENFFRMFFGKEVKVRMRPGFFPFVEPGFEIDMSCLVCGGKGCSVCSKTGWIEMMGAGMVHPNVLKAAGLNPGHWQGFAFGMGLDRLVMMKHKISDIRLFYSGDLRFLKQF
jgi:phenylalanyl-tRNA synthetase alpha chain